MIKIFLRNGQEVELDENTKHEIQFGKRGDEFKTMLKNTLTLSSLNTSVIDYLIEHEMEVFHHIFTHSSANVMNNYEFYELLGDVTLNKSILWYLKDRFPQLNCSEGVKILTRMKINLVSKRSFADFAKQLNFWPFITASQEVRTLQMNKTLEDVFEALFGGLELMLDKHFGQGIGYGFCYEIIASLLSQIDISLKYSELFDAKTRIKELFDFFGEEKIGKLRYDSNKGEDRMHHVSVLQNNRVLASASSPLKIDAQQKASEKALRILKFKGFHKPLVGSYAKFCFE